MKFYKKIICTLFLMFTFLNPSYADNTVANNNEKEDERLNWQKFDGSTTKNSENLKGLVLDKSENEYYRMRGYTPSSDKPSLNDNSDTTKPSTQAKTNDLIEAIKEGDLLHAKNLLRVRGVNVKARDEDSRTALHWAAEQALVLDKDYVDIVHLLIRKYAQVDAKDKNGDTPLLIAARNDQVGIMEKLIAANADVNAQDNDLHTPLFWTTNFGYVDATKLLLDKNANARIRSRYNSTFLHLAVKALDNKTAIVKLLLEKEAGFLVLAKNNGGKTALAVLEEELAEAKNRPESLTTAEEKEYHDLIELLQQEMATAKANIEECSKALSKKAPSAKRHKEGFGKAPFNRTSRRGFKTPSSH